MKNIKLRQIWEVLHSSYWFVPTVMAVIAGSLAFGLLTVDRAGYAGPIEKLGWIYTGGADGARSLLSTVAGSIVSITATAFSITIVALQLASSQFGPRLLRNFMQDTGNQVVLGTFIGTFVYCLLVLRTIRGEGDGYSSFIPQVSVTGGILLALISTAVLIYFINHASTLIQASHIISEVSDDLDRAIKELFPETIGHGLPKSQRQVGEIPANFDLEACPVKANDKGYVQTIDDDKLMEITCQHKLIIRVLYRPGKHVVQGSDLVMVWPGERVNQKLVKQINDTFTLGRERTEQQDIQFPIDQLVEIALRAISPGINDPFTAIRCIDRLSAGLSQLAERDFPSAYRYDEDNNLRVIANPVTFAGLTDSAFNPIRQYSSSDVVVRIRLLEAIATIATHTRNQKHRAALLRHANIIKSASNEQVSQEYDRAFIDEQYQAAVKVLKQFNEVQS